MSSIDERIVQMQFENSQFEKGVNRTIKTLGNLKKNLEFDDATGSLEDFQKMGDSFSLANISDQLETLVDRTSWFGRTINGILDSVTDRVLNFGKSLSVGQISTGWNKYTEKTASVQTIINSTSKSLEEVNNYLSKLMWFSDETSYNFSEMTSALATLTSSGGDIDKLIPMIEGMATATSFAGKGAAEFSRVIYNLNQSYGQGYLSYIDWKSVEGTTVSSKQLKQAFLDAAVEAGTLKKTADGIYKTTKGTVVSVDNFSSTLNEKWATKDVMEGALGTFAAVMEEAYELVQNGTYETTAEAIEAIGNKYGETSYKAAKSAQSAKSFAEAVSSVADAVSTGWMRSFEIIFGDMEEATELWTKVTNGLLTVFTQGMEYRNKILKDWKDLGGRTKLIESLERAFKALWKIIEKVKESFKAVFPSITVDTLMDITNAIERMSWWLYYLAGGADAAAESINNLNNSSVEEATNIPFNGELKRGSKGDDVKQLQTKLEEAGFSVGEHGIDGILGPDTEAALKQYEESIGLAADGIYDQLTHYKLYGITIPIEFTGELKRGDKGDKVKLLQQWLEARGFSVGEHGIDGIFGPDTEAALKAFEESIGVTADGVYDQVTHDQLTWNKALEDTQKTAKETAKKASTMALFMKIVYARYQGLIDNVMGFVKLFFSLAHLAGQTATFIGKVILRIFKTFMPLVSSIVMVLGSLASDLADAINEWLNSGPFIKALTVIENWLKPVKEWAEDAGNAIMNFFGLKPDGTKIKYAEGEMSRFAEICEDVKKTIEPIVNWIKQAIRDIADFFGIDIDTRGTYEAADAIVDLASGNVNGIISGITNNVLSLGESTEQTTDEVCGFIKVVRSVKKFLKPITDWMKKAWSNVWNFFAVADETDKNGNSITSFAKKWEELKETLAPIFEWIAVTWNSIKEFFFGPSEKVEIAKGNSGGMSQWEKASDTVITFQIVLERFKKKVKPIIDWFKTVKNNIVNFFSVEDELDLNGNKITSFAKKWEKFKETLSPVVEWIEAKWGNIKNFFFEEDEDVFDKNGNKIDVITTFQKKLLEFKKFVSPVTMWLKQAWLDIKNFFGEADEESVDGTKITSFQKKWQIFKGNVKPIIDWLKDAWNNIINFFTVPSMVDENGEKITKFTDICQKVKTYLAPVAEWLSITWEKVKNFFTVADELDENGNAITSCSLFWKKAKDALKPVFEWLKNAWEWIKKAFSGKTISESLTNFWTALCETLSKLWNTICELFKSSNSEKAESKNPTIFQNLGNFFSRMSNFFDKNGLLIFAGGSIFAIVLKACSIIGKLFEQFNIIKNGLDKMTSATEKFKGKLPEKKFEWILRLGIGIALIAASIVAIGSMNQENLDRGISVVAAIVLAIIGIGVLAKVYLNKANDIKALYTVGKTFLHIGASILMIAGAIWVLGTMKTGALIKGGIAVAIIMAVLVIISKSVKSGNSYTTVTIRSKLSGFLGIAIVIAALAASIFVLGNMSIGSLAKGIIAMTVIVLGVMALMKSAKEGNTQGSATTMVRLAGIALVIAAMVGTIWVLGNMNTKKLIKGLLGLAAVMAILIAVIKVCGKMASGGSVSIIAKVSSIAILLMAMVWSISILGNMETDVLIKGLLALGVIVALLFVVMKSIVGQKMSIKDTTGLIAILVALGIFILIFAQAMKNMEGVDATMIAAVGFSIAAMLVAISYACKAIKTSNATFKDMLSSSAKLGAALAIVIAIVGAIMWFIGALNTWTDGGLASTIENAVPVFEAVGKAFDAIFSSAFGYIVTGIVAASVILSKLKSNGMSEQKKTEIIADSAMLTAALGVVIALIPLIFDAIGGINEAFNLVPTINEAIPVIGACGNCIKTLCESPMGYVVAGVVAVGALCGMLGDDSVKKIIDGTVDSAAIVTALDVVISLITAFFLVVGKISNETSMVQTITDAIPTITAVGNCIKTLCESPMGYVVAGVAAVGTLCGILGDSATQKIIDGTFDSMMIVTALGIVLSLITAFFTAVGKISGDEQSMASTITNSIPVIEACGACIESVCGTPMGYIAGAIAAISTLMSALLQGGAAKVAIIGDAVVLLITAALDLALGMLIGLFWVVGKLNGDEQSMAKTIENAGPVFQKIGECLGKFVGGLQSGEITGLAEAVTKFEGTTLSEEKSAIIVGLAESLKTLYDKFAGITVGWIIDETLANIFDVDSPFIKFCKGIRTFASSIGNFSEVAKGISPLTGLKARILVSAASSIKALYDTFENKNFFEAGWEKFSNIFGNGSEFNVFCKESMPNFATSVNEFGNSVKDIKIGILFKTALARKVAESIANFIHDISDKNGSMYIEPDNNSLLGWAVTGTDSEGSTFFGQMTNFATAANTCATEMKGLSDVTAEVELATSIAASIAKFLNGVSDPNSDTYIKAGKYGLTTWGWGEKQNATTFFGQLSSFASTIVELQGKIKEFSSNGFEADATAVLSVARSAAEFFSSLIETNNESVDGELNPDDYTIITENVEAYLTALSHLSTYADDISDALTDFKPLKMIAFGTGLSSIVNSLKELDQSNSIANLGSIAGLVTSLSSEENISEFDPTSVTSLVTSITTELSDHTEEFVDAGYYFGIGIGDGIKNSEFLAVESAKYLCQQIIDAVKGMFDENSPSKVAAGIGSYFGIGLANGINSTEHIATKSGTVIAEGVIDSTRNALRSLNDMVSDTVSGDPIIRPIVDMSDVESSSRRLNGLLSADRSIDLASGAVSSFSRMKAAQKAEAAAASATSGDGSQNSSYNDSVSLTGNNFYIRSEQDIHTLANEIASLTRQQQRSLGARY